MSLTTHVASAITGVALVLGAASIPQKPRPPIEIHSLEYAGGAIRQDRTVNTSGPYLAAWEAQIINARTGLIVRNCVGEGIWHYGPGRADPEIPIAEWVGNPLCELPPGYYQAQAKYEAGQFKTSARSDVFVIRKPEK